VWQTSDDIARASRQAASNGITMPRLAVSSSEITAAVIGVCVTPARNEAMPSNTTASGGAAGSSAVSVCPMPAPTASAGEKMPPGMPAHCDRMLAASLARPKLAEAP
jgi:hypothetical protein